MNLLLKIFISFLKIGAFAFGGGYAMLPLIEKEIVVNHHWITYKHFIDIIGISQMTPGPIAINSATFVGFTVSGVLGSLFGTLGVVTVSFILVSIATHYVLKFKESKAVKSIFMGMRPALIGLIVSAFISLSKTSYKDFFISLSNFSLKNSESIIIGLIVALLLLSKKVHPILVIIISGILGIIFYGVLPSLLF